MENDSWIGVKGIGGRQHGNKRASMNDANIPFRDANPVGRRGIPDDVVEGLLAKRATEVFFRHLSEVINGHILRRSK